MVVATSSDAEVSGTQAFVSKLVSSIVIAAVLAALDNQFKGTWAPWLHRAVPWIVAALVVYAVVVAISRIAPRLLQKSHDKRVEKQLKEQVAALLEAFKESMSQNYVKGAGSILNSLHTEKALDAHVVNLYGAHLAILSFAGQYLIADLRAGRLPAIVALTRLSDFHRDYTRVCCDLASAVSTTSRRDLHISWDEIRDNANAISERLASLCRHARELEGGGGETPSPYFQNVPRSHPI